MPVRTPGSMNSGFLPKYFRGQVIERQVKRRHDGRNHHRNPPPWGRRRAG